MTNLPGPLRRIVDLLTGEPSPEEKVRHLRSVRRAVYVEEEARAIEARLDAVLGSRVDVIQRREGAGDVPNGVDY